MWNGNVLFCGREWCLCVYFIFVVKNSGVLVVLVLCSPCGFEGLLSFSPVESMPDVHAR